MLLVSRSCLLFTGGCARSLQADAAGKLAHNIPRKSARPPMISSLPVNKLTEPDKFLTSAETNALPACVNGEMAMRDPAVWPPL
jgi:hypothetical protein